MASSSSLPEPEERFSSNMFDLYNFVSDLILNAHNRGIKVVSPTLVTLAGAFLSSFDKKIVLLKFVEHSHKHWTKIHDNQDDFFINHASKVFVSLPIDSVNAFRELFIIKDGQNKPIISDEDKACIFDFFKSLVKTSIRYLEKHPEEATQFSWFSLPEQKIIWGLK